MPDDSLDWMISVDDHVLEPKHLWQARVPAKYRDAAPKMVTDGGMDYWEYDGNRIATTGLAASAGKRRQEFSYEPVTYSDMRPGCYDSRERLKDMDVAGVLASMCFPSFPRFCGQIFYEAADKELALVCVKAYNDWMIEEWCGVAPGRFIPLLIIPLWDPKLAAEEVRRGAARGAHAIAFSENPEPLGLPTINDASRYWDPVWEACNETGTVVCMHIGSSSVPMRFSSDSYTVMNIAWGAGSRVSGTMLDWLFSSVFDRFPSLKIALSEGGIGWMPYFLERAEQVIDKQRYWASQGEQIYNAKTAQTQFDATKAIDFESFDLRQRFRDHVFGCFIDDMVGMKHIRELGVENVMIESDYPHSDSTWPDSLPHARRQLATTDLTDHEQWLVLRGNAERVFQFTPATPPLVPGRAEAFSAPAGG